MYAIATGGAFFIVIEFFFLLEMSLRLGPQLIISRLSSCRIHFWREGNIELAVDDITYSYVSIMLLVPLN